MTINPKDYLTPQQIKVLTGAKNTENVWKWIREGKMRAFKFGRNYLVEKKEFEKFWKEHKPVFEKFQQLYSERKN